MNEYQNVQRVVYGEGATFVPRCMGCGRIVKPFKKVKFDSEGQPVGNSGTCKKHGRIPMIFEGYY